MVRFRWLASLAGIPLRFWVLFVYVLLIVAPNNTYLPAGFRLALINYRPHAIVAIVALIIVDALRDPAALSSYLRRPRYVRLAVLAAIFPVYYVLVSGLKGDLRPTSVGLYGLWAITTFVAWPLFVRTWRQTDRWLRLLFAANLLAWVLPMVYSTVAGLPPDVVFKDIRSFGSINPDYFAQVIQVVFACALLAAPATPGGRVARALLLAATMVAIYSLDARNVLVFVVALAAVRPFLRAARRPGLVVAVVLALFACLSLTVSQYFESQRINRFSSGRLAFWSDHIEEAFERGDDAVTFLIGPGELPGASRAHRAYDPLGEQKTFAKFHSDNAYLELFFEAGVLGSLLFVWPYLLAVVAALRRIRRGRDPREVWAVAVLIAVACQSMFMSSIPTFASPAAFLFLSAFGIVHGPVIREVSGGDRRASAAACPRPSP